MFFCGDGLQTKFLAEFWQPKGTPSGTPYSYRKEKETHELIFSWLSWLVVLLVGMRAWRHIVILQIIGWQRQATLVYRVLLWYWTSRLWSIDICQNKVSADQYVTISQAQVSSLSRSHFFFFKLTADKVLVFDWIAGWCQGNLLKTGQDCSEAS